MDELQTPRIRYFLAHPHQGLWKIRAAEIKIEGELHTNYIVAEFSTILPNAEQEARELLGRLNG